MELQAEFTIRYRTYWSPVIDDDLETIVIDVAPVHHGRIPSADEVQRVIAKFEIKVRE
jgi:hypothetical protein